MIIFLERQADYLFFFEYIKNNEDAANALIYFPYPNLRADLVLAANEAGLDIESKLLSFATISMKYDNELYKLALRFSQAYVKAIRLNSLRLYGSREKFITSTSKRATIVRMHDQIASRLRLFYELKQHLQKCHPNKFVYIPGKEQPALIVKNLLSALCENISIKMLTEHLPNNYKSTALFMSTNSAAFCAKNPLKLPSLANNKARIPRGAISFIVNPADKQYGHTLEPLLPILLSKNTPCAVFNIASRHTPTWLDSEALKPHIKSGKLVYFPKTVNRTPLSYKETEQRLMQVSARDFEKFVETQFKPDEKIYGNMISAYLSRFAFSLISLVKECTEYFLPITRKSSALVLVPGRVLESGIATGLAIEQKIPNIEIVGILSKTNRYVTPIAQEAFCIDPYSASVLTDFLNMPKEAVKVTGGVKIEHGLSSVRTLSQSNARQSIPEFNNIRDQKIIMLASQPLDIKYASRIAEIAIKSCKMAGDINLVIKLHPNETDVHKNCYVNLAKELNFTKLIILQDRPVMKVVVSSNIVMTYFSTVGLEAFALKKPVICINAFQEFLPFDLVEMGIASEAKSELELLQKIKDIFSKKNDTLTYHPSLEAVRDGQAIERLADMLVTRSVAQRELVSRLRSSYYKRKIKSVRSRLLGTS